MTFLTMLSLLGPASIAIALLVLALLSQRLGAVLKTRAYYRWLYLSIVLIIVGILFRLFYSPNLDDETALLYDIPIVVGLLIGVIVAWRYWGWLLGDRGKGIKDWNR